MIRSLPLLAISATLLGLSSCAYTGNPNEGGLFGWSQSMADDRIAAREEHLEDIERENAYQRGRTSALREEEAYQRRQLRKY
jgi:hypothetical protein